MKLRLTFLLLLVHSVLWAQDKSYSFNFKIKGLQDSLVYLCHYDGGRLFFNDTTTVNKKGEFSFKGKKEKLHGIYAVLLANKQDYFEIVVTEPQISMQTTRQNMVMDMEVKKSKENKAYYEYLKFVTKASERLMAIDSLLKDSKDDARKAKLTAEKKAKHEEMETFRKNYIQKNNDLFCVKLLKSSMDPKVPEFKTANNEIDQEARYLYFKAHFFDSVDLMDDRILRSPVLNKKIEYYVQNLTPQTPDSIVEAARHLLSMTNEGSDIYKYIAQYVTTTYERSELMGMDAVFVGMCELVYAQDKAWWFDSTKVANIKEQYNVRKNLILGKKAENIVLPDTNEKWTSLYDVKADYTILFFWKPTCGHCKKEMPKLKKFYEKWKDKGVQVFAVSTEFENKDWKAYVKEHNLPWINVSDNPEVNKNAYVHIGKGETTLNSLNFRDFWDLYATPQCYVLDKDKKIIAKRLMSEQIDEFLTNMSQLEQEKATQP